MIAVRDRADRAAFARLFDFYGPRIMAMCLRAGVNRARAEDIVQDVMLTVWRKSAQFDPARAQVSAWIYRIARNRNIDLLRKSARPLPEALEPPPEEADDAAQVLALDQETAHLRAALSRLKPAQRDLILRAYMGELTHQEIQAETGLPLGTIKSRIRLGLDRLRHELKDIRHS